MAISTSAAILGSAVLGTGASLIGAGKQSAAANNAANLGAQATQQATALQGQMWEDQKALYLDSLARQQPGIDAGNTALATLMQAYGLSVPASLQQPSQTAPAQPVSAPASGASGGSVDWGAYLGANPDLGGEAQRVVGTGEFSSPEQYAAWHWQNYGQNEVGPGNARVAPGSTTQPQAAAPAATGNAWAEPAVDARPRNVYVPPSAAQQVASGASGVPLRPDQMVANLAPGEYVDLFPGLDMNFQASPDYEWRLNQGLEAVDSRNSTAGLRKSGAAMKSLNDYGQGAASQEYGNWWNRQTGAYGDWWNRGRTTFNDWWDQGETAHANAWNRETAERNNYLSGLAGIANVGQGAGQQAAQTASGLGAAGMNFAGNVGNLALGNAALQGQAGVAGANAWATGLGGAAGTLSGLVTNYANQNQYTPAASPTGFNGWYGGGATNSAATGFTPSSPSLIRY